MKLKNPVFFSLLVLTLFSFSCSHSGKPDVNSMAEGQVDMELTSLMTTNMFATWSLSMMHCSVQKQILQKAKYFAETKRDNERMFRNDSADTKKYLAKQLADEKHKYYTSLPEKIQQNKKEMQQLYMNLIQSYQKAKKDLSDRGQALVDRKIYFVQWHMKEELHKYDDTLQHLDNIIRDAKKKAQEEAK